MKHNVVIFPHPCLTTPAAPVTVFDNALRSLVSSLYETMYQYDGIGLAAPQVNIARNIVVIDTSAERNQARALINPVITEKMGEATETEGCLSFPGILIDVTRAIHIVVEAQNEYGESVTLNASDLFARCIQHEIDHLNGVVFIDYLSRLKRERALKKMRQHLQKTAKQVSDSE